MTRTPKVPQNVNPKVLVTVSRLGIVLFVLFHRLYWEILQNITGIGSIQNEITNVRCTNGTSPMQGALHDNLRIIKEIQI